MWNTYVLKSTIDGKRYIGRTDNLERRLCEHNTGKVRSTRHRRPLTILYTETYDTSLEARNREHYFKTHRGYNELNKILRNGL